MTTTPTLTDRQAVLHLFARVDGPGAADAYDQIRAVWQRCSSTLDVTEAIAALDLPADLPPTLDTVGVGAVAAAYAKGPGVLQALAHREAGVLCLSIAHAPESPGWDWERLARTWDDLTAGTTSALLGHVRLYLGFHPADATPSWIEAATRGARPNGNQRWPRPVRVDRNRHVWETGPGEDGRAGRTLVIAAPAGTDDEVSAWLWSPGAGARAPLTRYLVDAAKMHALVRTLRDERQVIELRARIDEGADRLVGLMSGAATEDKLRAALQQVAVTQAESAGVIDTIAWCRRAGLSAEAAAANLSAARKAHLDGDAEHGPFADDVAMTGSLRDHLDDDLHYLTVARERAQQLTDVVGTVLAGRLEERREAGHRRQERFGLVQAALIGAVLMGLTAIQSLSYTVPMPASAKPALIATLGAIALYLAAIAVRLVLPSRRALLSWLEDLALALAIGSALWLAAAWISRRAFGHVLPWGLTLGAFGAGIVAAAAVSVVRRKRR
ncbi:CATRA conflict system CASPASE/TPR repeat-associated protein [Paractinoplanes globisporus]|uniref:CATRA conflict system CASPASE/TPR repeat-associated protein n=1 Tax=Paractinoplanes globisporus TaxID=113565 RepID=A0ABW6WBS8_9ACTN|nr:CATRA conflict system CASPASE/TPR repeat-associated protein [Actinoplanes globisporus]